MRLRKVYATVGAATLVGAAAPVMMAAPAQAGHEWAYVFNGNAADRGILHLPSNTVYSCRTGGRDVVTIYRTNTGHQDAVTDTTNNEFCPNRAVSNGLVTELKVCTDGIVCTDWVRVRH